MSLHIGNLSSRTRKDELEQVFRRFGRCNVRIKDGYGFVVYEFHPDSEKALRALRGRSICGERLTLTWSKKQPRSFEKYSRDSQSYVSHGRNSASKIPSLNGLPDPRLIGKQPDDVAGRHNSAVMLDGGKHYSGEELHDFTTDLLNDDGGAVPKIVDSGRWGEQVDGMLNDNGVCNSLIFDRYEPYQGYERKDKEENHWMRNPGSSVIRNCKEDIGRAENSGTILNMPSDSKSRQTCYNCLALGHKICDCPRKLSRFYHRPEKEINNKSEGEAKLEIGCQSMGKTRSSRDTDLRHKTDRKTFDSKELWMSTEDRKSPIVNETERDERKDHRRTKKSRSDYGSSGKHSAKKARRSLSSCSRHTSSISQSTIKNSKSVPRSVARSRSRSMSYGTHNNLRSSSGSYYSKSKTGGKHRSQSSSPTSLSLSLSLGQPLSPSIKAQWNHKGTLDETTSPKSKYIQIEQKGPIGNDSCFENDKIEVMIDAVNSINTVSALHLENDFGKFGHPHKNNDIKSKSSLEITNLDTSLPELGALPNCFLSAEGSRETLDHQNSGAVEVEHMLTRKQKPDSLVSSCSHSGCPTSISSEEMCVALKHYGLEPTAESFRNLPIEAFFGSARLWPWEIIYYRRMKKGLISVENYARRVVQNQEFGIVDKYIRSSSGWGDKDQDSTWNLKGFAG